MVTTEDIHQILASMQVEINSLKQMFDEQLAINNARQHEIAVMQRKIQELISNTDDESYIYGGWE
jgi:hypothetical protein